MRPWRRRSWRPARPRSRPRSRSGSGVWSLSMWSAPFEGEHRSGRRGQPGRPSAGMSASMRGCTPDTRPAGPVYRPPPAAAREWDRCSIDPRPARSPTPGVLPVLRRRGPGPVRGEGQVAAPPPAQLLAGLGQAHAPHGPDGGPGRPRRVGGGRQRGRCADPRALAHSGAPAPLQRPAQGRQELPLAGGHAHRGVAAARRWCGAASARASATSAPTATPAPSAPPSTCWCGASRSAPARTPSSPATSGSAGPACSTTSTAARGRASAPSTTRPTTATSRT